VASREERALSFGAVAHDYDRFRPQPPPAAVDWLLPARCEVAVDLAAGTGLLTRVLARKVPHVIAVEPDTRMAAVLAERSPGVRVVRGRGEAIPLPDASADAVLVASAWHWLDPGRAVPEIGRVLRDGGRLGVIWTSRDRDVSWVRELGWPGAGAPGDGPGGEWQRRRRREVILPPGAVFTGVETASFSFTRPMPVGDVTGMLATYSGIITASPADRAAAVAHAGAVLDRHFPGATRIEVPMRAWCWRADRIPRAASPKNG
jgi:SAM-dependent methyltransferase